MAQESGSGVCVECNTMSTREVYVSGALVSNQQKPEPAQRFNVDQDSETSGLELELRSNTSVCSTVFVVTHDPTTRAQPRDMSLLW
jgi:hypothetical protein